jgi:hypothetical protein
MGRKCEGYKEQKGGWYGEDEDSSSQTKYYCKQQYKYLSDGLVCTNQTRSNPTLSWKGLYKHFVRRLEPSWIFCPTK